MRTVIAKTREKQKLKVNEVSMKNQEYQLGKSQYILYIKNLLATLVNS